MTIREALAEGAALLSASGVPEGRLDAALLLEGLLGLPRLGLPPRLDEALGAEALARYRAALARRALREPLQYILGFAHFMGFEYLCRPGVLIPRADSEAMCVFAARNAKPGAKALDLCCGSGCLGLSLKKKRPDVGVTLSDVSPLACALTRENARRLGAEARVAEGDFLRPFPGERFDLILCNPPYIPAGELAGLQAEVGFEPALALDGGADGLAFYRRLAREAAGFLTPGGILLMETGDGQAEAAAALFVPPFAPPLVHRDTAGSPRFLETGLPRQGELI